MISIDHLKQLREETGVSITECQKALKEAGGDIEKAKEILRKWGKDLAGKKSEREVKQGIIESYIHPNKKIGVLLDLRCETDFVARSEDFRNLAHNLTLHIAGMNPFYIKPEDIPEEVVAGEKDIYREQFSKSGKPEKIIDQIVEGKLKNYKEEISLLTQPFVKNPDKTVGDLIQEYIAKLGENIIVKRFVRYEI
jgi:elongation factor Ts